MPLKKRSRWDKPSRWDKDYYPSKQETLLKTGRSDSTEVQNSRLYANDGSQPPENASLKDAPPSGLIFMCSSLTKRDCFRYKVFGLPLARRDLVERVVPGTLLFLFDFDLRELYGIYEAVSHGGLNLEPKAFQEFEGSYPAQVRFDIYRECLPLSEDIFKDALKENYYARNKFNFDLTPQQVSKLIQLFCPIEPPRKSIGSRSIMNRLHQADHPRQGLVDNSTRVPDPMNPRFTDSQYTFPPESSKVEEGIQGYPLLPGLQVQDQDGYASLLSHKRRYEHALIDPTLLPPKHPYENNPIDPLATKKGLLDKSHMDEVDQLALRYLQQSNPGVGDVGLLSLDHYGRNSLAPQIDHLARHGLSPLSQHDLVHSRAAVGAERLAEIELIDHAFRNQESNLHMSHFIRGPNISEKNLAATWSPSATVGRQIGASDSLRQQPVGHYAIRRS